MPHEQYPQGLLQRFCVERAFEQNRTLCAVREWLAA
jgi:hypothetical protein